MFVWRTWVSYRGFGTKDYGALFLFGIIPIFVTVRIR